MLMLLRRLMVGLAAGVLGLTLMPSAASATLGPPVPGSGSVSCSLSATIRFSPPLTKSGGGTKQAGLTTKLSNCKTYGGGEQVSSGRFQGHFATSPYSCKTLEQTGAPLTGSARWANGYDNGRRAPFEPSSIKANDVVNGSFVGTARVVLTFPSSLSSLCASPKGVKSAAATGTLTLGPACGPGHGALTIFRLAPASVMCGGVYVPAIITAGPDGNLWFTNGGETANNKIGRITPSGDVSFYKLPDNGSASGITLGPDGNLWFTGGTSGKSAIGRMTTSGTVTYFPLASGFAGPITPGPDGALWFNDYPPVGTSGTSIDRITTSGVITAFTSPLIDGPAGLTAGPDGAVWFANAANSTIGRITTSGVVSVFTSPLITGPTGITAGPDGALWFTDGNAIGRITTTGTVTRYKSSTTPDPWSITAGPDGELWFSNYAGSLIGRMNTSGAVTAHYSDPSILVPFDITAGPDGNMWFTNYGADTIGRITPP